MGLFRKTSVQTMRQVSGISAVSEQGRPARPHEGSVRATVLGGYEDLEVVGESHFQDNLWRLVGGRHKAEVRVRMDVLGQLDEILPGQEPPHSW